MSKKCCVLTCGVVQTRGEPVLHSFPDPFEEKTRFYAWVFAIGGDMPGLHCVYIYNNCLICHRHFEKKFHCPGNRLSSLAIPSLHLEEIGLTNTQSSVETYYPNYKHPFDLGFPQEQEEIINLAPANSRSSAQDPASKETFQFHPGAIKYFGEATLKRVKKSTITTAITTIPKVPKKVPPPMPDDVIDVDMYTEEDKQNGCQHEASDKVPKVPKKVQPPMPDDVIDADMYTEEDKQKECQHEASDKVPKVLKKVPPPKPDDVIDADVYTEEDKQKEDNREQDSQTECQVIEEEETNFLQQGYICNNCVALINRLRYTCVQCPHYEMCRNCERRGAHSHHYMLRVPNVRPYCEIQEVMNTIRYHLANSLDPDAFPPMPTHADKGYLTEIKTEQIEEPDPVSTNVATTTDSEHSPLSKIPVYQPCNIPQNLQFDPSSTVYSSEKIERPDDLIQDIKPVVPTDTKDNIFLLGDDDNLNTSYDVMFNTSEVKHEQGTPECCSSVDLSVT